MPTYLERTLEAIEQHEDDEHYVHGGVSREKIKQYLENTYQDEYDFHNNEKQLNHLNKILTQAVESGVLCHPHNHTNSFKISPQSTPTKAKKSSKKSQAKKSPK